MVQQQFPRDAFCEGGLQKGWLRAEMALQVEGLRYPRAKSRGFVVVF